MLKFTSTCTSNRNMHKWWNRQLHASTQTHAHITVSIGRMFSCKFILGTELKKKKLIKKKSALLEVFAFLKSPANRRWTQVRLRWDMRSSDTANMISYAGGSSVSYSKNRHKILSRQKDIAYSFDCICKHFIFWAVRAVQKLWREVGGGAP